MMKLAHLKIYIALQTVAGRKEVIYNLEYVPVI